MTTALFFSAMVLSGTQAQSRDPLDDAVATQAGFRMAYEKSAPEPGDAFHLHRFYIRGADQARLSVSILITKTEKRAQDLWNSPLLRYTTDAPRPAKLPSKKPLSGVFKYHPDLEGGSSSLSLIDGRTLISVQMHFEGKKVGDRIVWNRPQGAADLVVLEAMTRNAVRRAASVQSVGVGLR